MNRTHIAAVAACAALLGVLGTRRPGEEVAASAPAPLPPPPPRSAMRGAAIATSPPADDVPTVEVWIHSDDRHFRGFMTFGWADDAPGWADVATRGWAPSAVETVVRHFPMAGQHFPEGFRPSDLGHLLLHVDPWLAAGALQLDVPVSRWMGRAHPDAETDPVARLAESIVVSHPDHPASELASRIHLSSRPIDTDQAQLQRMALDGMAASPTPGVARQHLGLLTNDPVVRLTDAEFAMMARLLDGVEADWPLAAVFAAAAAANQGLDPEPWVALTDRIETCERPAVVPCSLALDTWTGLRPRMAPPTDWIEALHASVRGCGIPPGPSADGQLRGAWVLRPDDAADQPLFDCVAAATKIHPEEGQRVRIEVRGVFFR